MNAEQLRNQRFDRTLDEITKRELKSFRQDTLERDKAEQQKAKAKDRPEPVPTKGK